MRAPSGLEGATKVDEGQWETSKVKVCELDNEAIKLIGCVDCRFFLCTLSSCSVAFGAYKKMKEKNAHRREGQNSNVCGRSKIARRLPTSQSGANSFHLEPPPLQEPDPPSPLPMHAAPNQQHSAPLRPVAKSIERKKKVINEN